jgi:16S rRNA (cytidine1402-2'-O)-methyltransferase
MHEHNEVSYSNRIISDLLAGENFALLSDAGTPLISDPGYVLVKHAKDAGIRVEPIPGACAIIAALSAAGLATDKFSFQGFLPAKQQARLSKLKGLSDSDSTLIFYESTHRIIVSMQDLLEVFENREMVLAKEITKSNENIIKGSASEIISWLQYDVKRQKGEFVLLVSGAEKQADAEKIELDVLVLLQKLCENMSVKSASKLAAEITGLKKNYLYKLALEEK